ncbi:MAG: methyltransferase domain-containing protein [Planctomycetaceae bacterium]
MTTTTTGTHDTTESAVYQRYAAASRQVEPSLCCPVTYAGDYLKNIPTEILEKDYGCGDPSPYVQTGDTVVDLGSGAGKLCYIMSQVVGPTGKVIGVDCNTEMLALSRKYLGEISQRLGFANVEFRYGMIQDLQLNLELLEAELGKSPIGSAEQWLTARNIESQLRQKHPLISDHSVDCVVSNCVLNLVRQQDRKQLFREIFRVLKRGGRAAISDIVSDETVPQQLQNDGELWSGCLSGAFREDQFLEAFVEAGFHGIEIVKRQAEPWQTVDGIEFRSVTVIAYKGKQGVCLDRNQAVIYRGPFASVVDDDGNTYLRGQRMAVCEKVFGLLQRAPYSSLFEFIEPRTSVPVEEAPHFDCSQTSLRDPRVTKGAEYRATKTAPESCCGDDQTDCFSDDTFVALS